MFKNVSDIDISDIDLSDIDILDIDDDINSSVSCVSVSGSVIDTLSILSNGSIKHNKSIKSNKSNKSHKSNKSGKSKKSKKNKYVVDVDNFMKELELNKNTKPKKETKIDKNYINNIDENKSIKLKMTEIMTYSILIMILMMIYNYGGSFMQRLTDLAGYFRIFGQINQSNQINYIDQQHYKPINHIQHSIPKITIDPLNAGHNNYNTHDYDDSYYNACADTDCLDQYF